MKARNYAEVISEIRRLTNCEHIIIHTDDGFSSAISGLMRLIGPDFIGIGNRNKFYGEIYRRFKILTAQ